MVLSSLLLGVFGACQRARLCAERAVAACDETTRAAERLSLMRDCCLLKLLTALPPDRVGVYRLLKMGGSLKPRQTTKASALELRDDLGLAR